MDKIERASERTILLLSEISTCLEQNNLSIKAKRYRAGIEKLKKGRTVAVVCGEFKRGKSSFINALLNEPELCPVNIDITTSMVTQIRHGEKEGCTVYFTKESDKAPVAVSTQQISEFVTEQMNRGNQKEVGLVDVTINNDFLHKNSMLIIDTPGVGSLNQQHSKVTYSYLNAADVIIFVSDVTSPLTTSEIDFIKSAKKLCSNFFFILSKTDISPDWEVIEEENRKKLLEIFKENEIKIFPVSGHNKLDYLETNDEESLEDSNFPQLEQSLCSELSGSIARNLLKAPLEEARCEAEALLKNLALEFNSFNKGNSELIASARDRLTEYQLKLSEYQKVNSKWRTVYNDFKSDIFLDANNLMREEYNALQNELLGLVKEKKAVSSDEAMNSFIKERVLDINTRVNNFINLSFRNFQNKLTKEGGLELEVPDFTLKDIEIQKLKSTAWKDSISKFDRFKDFGRSIGSGGMVIGGIATVATLLSGGTLFPVIASIIGGSALNGLVVVSGVGVGYMDYKKRMLGKEKDDASKTCIKYLQQCQQDSSLTMKKQLEELLRNLRDNIDDTLKENIELSQKTINEINLNLKLEAGEAEKKSKKIKTQAEQLKGLTAQIGELLITGRTETTYKVTWFKYSETPKLIVYLQGEEKVETTIDQLEFWTVRSKRTENSQLDKVKYIEFYYPNKLLKEMELIDTPGLASTHVIDAQSTLDFLGLDVNQVNEATSEEASKADAIIYAFTKGMHEKDENVLQALQGSIFANASPINAIGALTKVDIYWSSGYDNPLEAGKHIINNLLTNPQVKKLLYTVSPIAGIIAENSNSLSEREKEILTLLGQLPAETFDKLIKDAARFTKKQREDVPVPPEERRLVWDRLDQYGVNTAVKGLKQGISIDGLSSYLYEKSGASELVGIIRQHFGNRAFLIKMSYILSRVKYLTNGLYNQYRIKNKMVTGILEIISTECEKFQSEEHAFSELRVLQYYYNGDLQLEEDEVEEFLQIVGERGANCEARLGMNEPRPIAQLMDIAKEKAGRWNSKGSNCWFYSSKYYEEACRVLARSCEIMHYHLSFLSGCGSGSSN